MTDSETMKITLYGPDLGNDTDKTLSSFIDELTETLNKIPETYRGLATISCGSDWDMYTYVEYERPETDEEKHYRLERDSRSRVENEKRDRELLAKLKAQYE